MNMSEIEEKLNKHQLKVRFIGYIIMCYRYSKEERSYDDEMRLYSIEFVSEIQRTNKLFAADANIWFKTGIRKLVIFETYQLIDCINFVSLISDFRFLTPLPVNYHKTGFANIDVFRIEEFLWKLKSSNISFYVSSDSLKIDKDFLLSGDVDNKVFILNQETEEGVKHVLTGTIKMIYTHLQKHLKLGMD